MRSRTPSLPAEPRRPIAVASESHDGATRETYSTGNIDAKVSGSICRDVTGQMTFAVWRSDPTCGPGTPCGPDRPAASIAVGAACDKPRRHGHGSGLTGRRARAAPAPRSGCPTEARGARLSHGTGEVEPIALIPTNAACHPLAEEPRTQSHASSRSARAISWPLRRGARDERASAVSGCVLNRRRIPPPLKGLTMKRRAVGGEPTVIARAWLKTSIFLRPAAGA